MSEKEEEGVSSGEERPRGECEIRCGAIKLWKHMKKGQGTKEASEASVSSRDDLSSKRAGSNSRQRVEFLIPVDDTAIKLARL